MGKELDGPVCLKHPNRLAVAHCSVCRRPVCQECLIEDDGFKCCSEACLKMAKESTRRSADVVERRDRANARVNVGGIVRWIIIALLLVCAWVYRNNIKQVWNKVTGKSITQMQQESYQKQKMRTNQMTNEAMDVERTQQHRLKK
ncbi:MAG: B-box zinc finger protein [Lentisphaeria bacterium]|nr:B-box zinc finger protein [Lentisphaeria bacterium]